MLKFVAALSLIKKNVSDDKINSTPKFLYLINMKYVHVLLWMHCYIAHKSNKVTAVRHMQL